VKVGDLVKIQKWCKNKHRVAIVTRAHDWDKAGVWIEYIDGQSSRKDESGGGYAMRENLILLSES